MSNLFYIVYFLGLIPFLFFFWRRLKEDYTSNQIFTAGFYIVLSTILFTLIFAFGVTKLFVSTPIFNTSGLWFWGGILGFCIGLTLSVWRLNLKFFETLEASTLGIIFWMDLIFLTDSIKSSSFISLAGFGFLSVLLFLFFFVDSRYKKFTWYRSGKIGFSGLAVSGLLFFVRALVALFFPFVLSFIGKVDALISAGFSFILFLLLYNLAEYDK